jgi:hypothetical protein
VSHPASIHEVVRRLVEDPEYRRRLTIEIEARTDPALVDRLVDYARARMATSGHAMARKVLTEAGVSWEAL